MKTFKQYFIEQNEKVLFDIINKKDHFWPVIIDWPIIDTDKIGELGSVAKVTLRDVMTGVKVKLDGSDLQGKKGKGTFEYMYFGKMVKGNFDALETVPLIIRKIQKRLPEIKDTQMKLIPKSVNGWKLDFMNDLVVQYVKEPDHQTVAVVTFHNIQNIMAGDRGHVSIHIRNRVDNGMGNEPVPEQPDLITAMGLDDIPKILKQINKDLNQG